MKYKDYHIALSNIPAREIHNLKRISCIKNVVKIANFKNLETRS